MVIGPIVLLKSLPFLYERKASYLKGFSAAAGHMDPKTMATDMDIKSQTNWKTRFLHAVFVWLLIECILVCVYCVPCKFLCLYKNVNAFYCCTLNFEIVSNNAGTIRLPRVHNNRTYVRLNRKESFHSHVEHSN